MSIEISDFQPEYTLSQNYDGVTILPLNSNYEDKGIKKMLFDKCDLNFIKTLKRNGVSSMLFEQNAANIVYQDNRSIDWVMPTMAIAQKVLENPELVEILLDTVKLFILNNFKGRNDDPTISCNFVYEENNKGYKKIEYQGSVSGLNEVKKILRRINK